MDAQQNADVNVIRRNMKDNLEALREMKRLSSGEEARRLSIVITNFEQGCMWLNLVRATENEPYDPAANMQVVDTIQ